MLQPKTKGSFGKQSESGICILPGGGKVLAEQFPSTDDEDAYRAAKHYCEADNANLEIEMK
eukprot:2095412-Ditylum_brightwellii.AAC.1